MKKILVTSVIAFAAMSAFADSTQTTVSTSQSTAAAVNAGSGNGNTVTTPVNIGCLVNCSTTDESARSAALISAQGAKDVADTTVKIKNTPSVSAPALTSSNDTCMGSSSGSANAPGIGISIGSTWVDKNCKMLKNSREMWNMGMKHAALKLLCTDPDNREALMATGFDCDDNSQAVRKSGKKVSMETSATDVTDPYIRSRLGMAPLVATK